MSSFDYNCIEFPPDIDYEKLLHYLRQNPEEVERLVDQYLSKDQKWLENERQLNELRKRRNQMIERLTNVEKNNEKFDELLAQIKHKENEVETIVSNVYEKDGYIYYEKPVQRVIDIAELRLRMNSLSVVPKLENQSTANVSTDPSTGKQTVDSSANNTNDLDDNSEIECVFDGIIESGVNNKPMMRQTIITSRTPLRPNDKVFSASSGILTESWESAKFVKKFNEKYSVKFDDKFIIGGNCISGKLIAYGRNPSIQLPVGERVIAYYKEITATIDCEKKLYSGTVAEPPKNPNNYRYLIFFDLNACRYVDPKEVFVIHEKVPFWEDLKDDDKENYEISEYAEFLKRYVKNYPERPMLRLQKDDRIKVKYQDKWETAKVLDIDANLALISYEKYIHTEWIYRGSIRLLDIHKEFTINKSSVKHRAGRSTTRIQRRLDQRSNAFVEWNTEELQEDDKKSRSVDDIEVLDRDLSNRKRKFKQTARKSTAKPSGHSSSSTCNALNMIDNELFNTIEIPVEKVPEFSKDLKPYIPHNCDEKCLEGVNENLSFRDENPFHIPLIVGYRRELIKYSNDKQKIRVLYRAPCGRRLRNINEVYKYLSKIGSVLDIDLFTFSSQFQMVRKSSPLKARFYIPDISQGLEAQPISCVNTVDETNLGNVRYSNERFPHEEVYFKIDPEFLSCCDCTDNCADSERCACQQLTIEASDTVRKNKIHYNSGYEYKRLSDFVMTGIFECNQKCPCNSRCVNRVVQNGIKCRLQLFKTLKKGWGVRVLHDVPKGAFLCLYAAQILNEEVADKEGKTFGDEYLADLDYIEVCEHHKEGYESDVEEDDEDYDEESDESYQEEDDEDDHDYKYSGKTKLRNTSVFETPLENSNIVYGGRRRNEDKSKTRYSIREDFFKEEFSYSLDAKKVGNIGRYLNHSCEPNCFVQNVFVDTHDLRFPWVSFFAKKDILAYEELTWDYNYQIGSIPGRKMPCFCGSNRCRKRLL